MALKTSLLAWIGAGQAARVAEGLRDRIAAQGGGASLGLTGRQVGAWDRLLATLNLLPRPFMALGTVLVIGAALIAPDWFAARMQALAQMPDAVWWILGGVISLMFGAGIQAREQAFARELLANTVPPDPLLSATPGTDAELALVADAPGDNPALAEWLAETRP